MAVETKLCTKCNKELPLEKFANGFDIKNKDFWCSSCRHKFVRDEKTLQKYCKENLRIFHIELFNRSIEKSKGKAKDEKDLMKKAVNLYFRQMNIPPNDEKLVNNKQKQEKKQHNILPIDFEVTSELEEKWGFGYTPQLYYLFEKKYQRLIRSYGEKTELHTEGLLVYIRYRVREELATADGRVKEAKEWGALASKAAQDAKINVSQLSKSDISGGIDVLSQLFEAVESEIGIIPLLPKLLEQPYDDADMIIWCIINYLRRLEEKPNVKYKDIYDFYEEMLEEHYKQNGYNDEQIEQFLKKRNNVFRDMEKIYIEPVYTKQLDEDGDD